MALEKNGVDIKGKKITILGAGGAAKAIAIECALLDAKEIVIINRDSQKGKNLVHRIASNTKTKAKYVAWQGTAVTEDDTDILVNATSIGLYPDTAVPDIDYSFMTQGKIVCDVIPNPPQTEFLTRAANQGCKTINGLGMLVNQGLIGFKIWTGKEANEQVMKKALMNVFGV